VAVFGATERVVKNFVKPGSLDWRLETLGQEAGALGLTLALFKMHGRAAQLLLPKGAWQWRPLAAGTGMYSGVVHSHFWEEKLGWREAGSWDSLMTGSLETFLQLKTMGHLSHQMMGPRYGAWVASLEAKAESEFQKISWENAEGIPLQGDLAPAGGSMNPHEASSNGLIWNMGGEEGGGFGPKKKIAQVIPLIRPRQKNTKADDRNTPVSPFEVSVDNHYPIHEDMVFDLVRYVDAFNLEKIEESPINFSKSYSTFQERFDYLSSIFGKMPAQEFDAEKLFAAYLELLNVSIAAKPKRSLAAKIPLGLLLEELVPIYIHIRRDHLPSALAELADARPFDVMNREVWRATTYLTMRLLQGASATDQTLYDVANNFAQGFPGKVKAGLAFNLHRLAMYRLNEDSRLPKFRGKMLSSPVPLDNTLYAIDVFFSFPRDIMGGLVEINRMPPRQPGEVKNVAPRVYTLLHAAQKAAQFSD
jgi:hypothetical protein